MSIGRTLVGICLLLLLVSSPTGAQGPRPFAIPKTKAEWESGRADLARYIEAIPREGERLTPLWSSSKYRPVRETLDGVIIETASLGGPGTRFDSFATYAWRADDPTRRRPGIVCLASSIDAIDLLGASRPPDHAVPGTPDWGWRDPRPFLVEMARRGFVVLFIHVPRSAVRDESRGNPWNHALWLDRVWLLDLMRQPEVDPGKIGVLGIGPGATRAAWLMAMEPAVKSAVLLGGMTRAADRLGRYPEARRPNWLGLLADGRDLDAIVALCAGPGRTLEWTVGDRDPTVSAAAVDAVEKTGKAMDKVVGDGHSFHVTRLGRHDGRYGRLQWLGATEIFEKAFFPQGPTPLGHPPEPEPPVSPEFVDLAAHGLAGWSVEMSQRPTTWTWRDGVIACKPGPNEYGWLRAPIEVGDFILSVEWKVPPGGNSGIFLRGRPVPWTFPPSSTYKRVVSSLGLDWPSRTGLELQAQDDLAYYAGRVGAADKFSSGSLYRHAAPSENPTRPPGQWNTYTVRARGPRVEVWSNGKQVLDTEVDRYPLTLATPPLRGYVGLQNHGAPAKFRNVKLLRLGP